MAEERDRIARDLHDLVIQRVFGAGMRLSSMLPTAEGATAERLREVVAELDSVISDIRTTIFDLQTEPTVRGGLRASVRQLAADAAERLGFPPRVRFAGPVDTVVDRDAAEQLLAVLRESLSNVIRHAAGLVGRGRGRRRRAPSSSCGCPTTASARRRGRAPASGSATWPPAPPRSAAPSRSALATLRAPSSSGGCRWAPWSVAERAP